MALLCGIQCGNLYTFHVALSHVYKLYTRRKIQGCVFFLLHSSATLVSKASCNLQPGCSSANRWLCCAALNSCFCNNFYVACHTVAIATSRQNYVLNVGFAVPDCPPNYCSKFSEQSVPLHLPSIVQVIWADIQFSYRLENCFLLLSDCESMLLRHLQDVCENLGVLNGFFPCWCHTKSVVLRHKFVDSVALIK